MNISDDRDLEETKLGPIDPLLEGGDTSFELLPALELIFGQMAAESPGVSQASWKRDSNFRTTVWLFNVSMKPGLSSPALQSLLLFIAPGRGSDLWWQWIMPLFLHSSKFYTGTRVRNDIDADRSITRIDMAAAAFVMELLAGALSGALSVIMELDLQLEAIHPAFELSALGRQNSPAVICCCGLTTMGQSGSVIILLPRSMLDPFRALLSRNVSAESVAPDKQWSTLLHDCVVQTEIQISATMDREGLTLEDIARLEIGQVIELAMSPTESDQA